MALLRDTPPSEYERVRHDPGQLAAYRARLYGPEVWAWLSQQYGAPKPAAKKEKTKFLGIDILP